MIRLLGLILILIAGMARAETVTPSSGEHEGFTRIVVNLAEPTPWQVGRMPDGYVLRLAREGIRYDLTQVFRNIPRTRLAAIWADPVTGDLNLGIGCACHAMPFEFRDNVIVIDIKDGPPPRGSSFEQSLDGGAVPRLAARGARRPKSRPDTVTGPAFNGTGTLTGPAMELDSQPAPDLDSLRETLLQQLSRGAAQGLVTMTMPDEVRSGATDIDPDDRPDSRPGSRVGLGVSALTQFDRRPDLTPEGAVCLTDERLDLAGWADARPFPEQFAAARGALLGEFDRAAPDAVGRLVRLQVHFGFGLEARATLRSLSVGAPDAAIWETMALIVDGERVPPDNPFVGQEDCDTAAALWSVLARPDLRRSDRPDRAAVLRSFSALPLWLRRSLGPDLAARFLAVDDTATARAIRDAILRAPGDPGPGARLVDARLDLLGGRQDEAVAAIEAVTRDAGPQLPEAMIELVDAKLATRAEMDLATVETIEALLAENRTGQLEPALRRALGIARALGGDFAAAFAISAEGKPDFDADLWPLLAERGPDAALLAAAVRAPGDLPQTDPETRATIAGRLIGLGFPDAGLAWMPPLGGGAVELVLLSADAELMRRDARAALRLLAGQTGAEADRLRAEAQVQLGDSRAAAAAFEAAGDTEAAMRATWLAQDWAAVAENAADPARARAATFAMATSQDLPPLVLDPGLDTTASPLPRTPLARGRALVEDIAAARAAVASLLTAVPGPGALLP